MSEPCDLCKQITKKLDQDNICHSLKNELIQVNGSLNEAIKENFKYYIIVDLVIKLLESKTCNSSSTFRHDNNKESSASSSPLYLHLVKKSLSPKSSSGIDLFGLNKEFIDEVMHKKQISLTEKQELKKFVEKSIEDFCIKLTEYSGFAYKYRNNWKKSFKVCLESLLSDCDSLAAADVEISSNQKEINNSLVTYYEDLSEGLSMLTELTSLYEKKLDFELLLGELYLERCSTLSLKIKRFESEILKTTYNTQSILALKTINNDLDQRAKEFEDLFHSTNSHLQTYSVLGPQYETLVKEYIELSQSIQQQQLTIDSWKLKQSNNETITETDNIFEETYE